MSWRWSRKKAAAAALRRALADDRIRRAPRTTGAGAPFHFAGATAHHASNLDMQVSPLPPRRAFRRRQTVPRPTPAPSRRSWRMRHGRRPRQHHARCTACWCTSCEASRAPTHRRSSAASSQARRRPPYAKARSKPRFPGVRTPAFGHGGHAVHRGPESCICLARPRVPTTASSAPAPGGQAGEPAKMEGDASERPEVMRPPMLSGSGG